MARYLLSECCHAYVVVPVEVTAHLYVKRDGTLSNSINDSVASIRRQALGMQAEISESYCAECGAAVRVPS